MRRSGVAALAFVLITGAALGADLRGPVVCFYGAPPLDKLAEFPVVVLEPSLVAPSDVAALHRRGCRVLGYVSLGEDDRLRRGNGRGPGGQADWYLDEHTGPGTDKPGRDGQPDGNPEWGSYYVDPSNRGWRRLVKDDVRRIAALGMDGVFADTVAYPRDVFTARTERRIAGGLTRLLSSLKAWSRGGLVVVNNPDAEQLPAPGRVDGALIEMAAATDADWSELRLTARRWRDNRPDLTVSALIYLPASATPDVVCRRLGELSLPAALYHDDAAGRALTALPWSVCR
jgi:hypothetical protein